MVAKGICETCDEVQIDIEVMSKQMLDLIRSKDSWSQKELHKHLRAAGWTDIDFNFCLSLLRRKNKIVLMSD